MLREKLPRCLFTNRVQFVSAFSKMQRTSRHFPNPLPDYTPKSSGDFTENEILSNSQISQRIEGLWNEAVARFQNLDLSDYTVYTGTSGIALLYLLKNPDSMENLQEIKRLVTMQKFKARDCTFLCGNTGPLAIGAVICHKLGQKDEASNLIRHLEDWRNTAIDPKSRLPNEYLYGRAGYLFALLYVNKHIQPAPISKELIREVIHTMLICGQEEAKSRKVESPLMYVWHDTYYLGAAHGLSGILYLLLEIKDLLTENEINTLIKPTIDYLETLRFPSGNFPSNIESNSDKYVQWCHGAPGFLYLYCKAYKIFKEQRYLNIALKCGDIVWERGLLRKGYSLCHGVAGNAYCFLELYQTTGDVKHLHRAVQFAEWVINYTQKHEEHFPDRPLSLYEGLAGRLYLLLDLQNPMEAKFPGFTL